MADYGVYWKRYSVESGSSGRMLRTWLTNRKSFAEKLNPGDRLWMIASGEQILETQFAYIIDKPDLGPQGFAVGLLTVKGVKHNPYPKWKYEIDGDPNQCFMLKPPVLADHIFRPVSGKGADKTIPIGLVRMTQFEIDPIQVKELLEIFSVINPPPPEPPPPPESPPPPEKVLRAILERRGQKEFREKLLFAYGNRCAITQIAAIEALEACHLDPYAESGSHSIKNGIILRADLHTLFDFNLVAINPQNYQISLSKRLKGSGYDSLQEKKILLPSSEADRPDLELLKKRWDKKVL